MSGFGDRRGRSFVSDGARSPTRSGKESPLLSTTPLSESWMHSGVSVEDDGYLMNVLNEETRKAKALEKFQEVRITSRSRAASFEVQEGTHPVLAPVPPVIHPQGRGYTAPDVPGISRNISELTMGEAPLYADMSKRVTEESDYDDDSSLEKDIYTVNTNATVDNEDVIRKEFFAEIPDPYPHAKVFQRVVIQDAGDDFEGPDKEKASQMIGNCMSLREKWIGEHPFPSQDKDLHLSLTSSPRRGSANDSSPGAPGEGVATHTFRRRAEIAYDVHNSQIPPKCEHYSLEMVDGVMHIREMGSDGNVNPLAPRSFAVPDYDEFVEDYMTVYSSIFFGPVNSLAYTRLELLAGKFNLHVLLNDVRENDAQKSVPHRDFYNVRKVDTHVHHSACMNQKHLLRFIKAKLRKCPNEVVIYRDGKYLTLGDVFKSLSLTAYDLSIDTLDMHAHDTFHRFDRFNLKYNPAGQSRLREIFLKTDNYLDGKYLAQITREIFADLDASKYQLVEWRVSIYGRNINEFSKLAKWFYNNRLYHKNVRWLIQVPRLFHIYRKSDMVGSFHEMMENIFRPLFEVSLDPQSDIQLHYFLQTVVGFDSVDDESRPESGIINTDTELPDPSNWTNPENPPYGYWMYYMYANICTLNKLRATRGLCTFQFRPHCGEAGDIVHLVSTYLLAHQINHGILLRKNPALQYLYYLSQIGIAVSPLSNNKLFLDYDKNPFPKFFSQGMNISLSTDDPLMLHFTKDALVEEYSVATQVWKLSSTDQCEIARNSVLQCGWEAKYKRHFLGKDYEDIRETNVPEIRLQYRKETLDTELAEILKYCDD
jgi:AMP deaminase